MCLWGKIVDSGTIYWNWEPWNKADFYVCLCGDITNSVFVFVIFERCEIRKWKCQVGCWVYGSWVQENSLWVNVNHVSKLTVWGKNVEWDEKVTQVHFLRIYSVSWILKKNKDIRVKNNECDITESIDSNRNKWSTATSREGICLQKRHHWWLYLLLIGLF